MKPGPAPVPSFEFLAEPALVVRRNGRVLGANQPARALFSSDPVGGDLFEWLAEPRAELQALLRSASASSSPRIGALFLETKAGRKKFRVHGARIADGDDGPITVLRLLDMNSDQFALLTRRVSELDRQLRRRMQEKAALEEALRLNRTLLDELQHRVKNNIQMMMSLIRLSAGANEHPGIAEVVATARLRLQAMASTQEAVYRSTRAGTLRSGEFLRSLVVGIGESAGFSDALNCQIADLELTSEQAHCLSLIVNELVTNAGKHALRDGPGTIAVRLARNGSEIELTVRDDGPGMPEQTAVRRSGLHLVRSLCRQLGARFEIETRSGTLCRVCFESLEEAPS